MKKKLLSLLLITCLLVSSMPLAVFAENSNVFKESTSIIIDEEKYIFERTINDEIVTAVLKTMEGKIVESAIANHQTQEIAITNGNTMGFDAAFDSISAKSSIDWGKWSTNEEVATIKGKTAAGILVILAVLSPWVGATKCLTIASALVSMGADELKVKIKIRYGTDDEYQYYERVTYFYGDGDYLGSVSDSGKKFLD